jgi:hypothetical protein
MYKYTMKNRTQQTFTMFIIVLGQHVSILIESLLFLEGPEGDSIRIL